jgi:hypothetical protein
MRINPGSTPLQQADLVTRTREAGAGASSTAPAAPAAPATRTDRVEISDAGRALAAQGPEATPAEGMSPERLAELRQRVLGGAYNSLAVVDQIARRMLQSGDV